MALLVPVGLQLLETVFLQASNENYCTSTAVWYFVYTWWSPLRDSEPIKDIAM